MVEGTRRPRIRPSEEVALGRRGSWSVSRCQAGWAVNITARVTPCPVPTFHGVDTPKLTGDMAGQSTPATTLLDRCGVSYRLHTYTPDSRASSYGAEAAEALGLAAHRVFKTLIAELDGRLIVAVVPVSGELDLRALAAVMGAKKGRMAAAADAQRATGYVTGGISPLGHRKQLPVVIDVSVWEFETVFCSAGRRGLQLELAPDALVQAAKATLAAIVTTS